MAIPTQPWRVGAIAAACASLVFVVAVAPGQARPLTAATSADAPPLTTSPNWSGYVATGSSDHTINYSSVTGTWVVPAATCGANSAGGFSSTWIGLGGYTTKKQEEVGTDSNCDASGNPIYYGWFELVPYIAYNVPKQDKVSAGDTMTGLVKILSISLVQLQIQNQTKHWTFTRNITFSAQDTSTAEWIVEAPASCLRFVCSQANLTNFGSLTMTNISATGDGKTGNLNTPGWNVTPLQLVPGKVLVPSLDPEATHTGTGQADSPAGATPGDASDDGSSFTDKWAPVSTRGL